MLDAILTALPVVAFGAAAGALLAAARRREAVRRLRVAEVNRALADLAAAAHGHYSEGQSLEHPLIGPLHTFGRALLTLSGLAVEVTATGLEDDVEGRRTVLRVRVSGARGPLLLRRAPRPVEVSAAGAFERCFLSPGAGQVPRELQGRLLDLARRATALELDGGTLTLEALPPDPDQPYLTDTARLRELAADLAAAARALAHLEAPVPAEPRPRHRDRDPSAVPGPA